MFGCSKITGARFLFANELLFLSLMEKKVTQNLEYKYSFLTETLSEIFHLSEELKAELRKLTFRKRLKKGELLVKQGDLCDKMYFIVKGLTRGYIQKGKQDITLWISVEKDWETAISSFFREMPATENIQALENTILEGLYAKDIEYLCNRFKEVNTIMRLIFQEYYLSAEGRALMCRIGNASEKYNYFIEHRGDLINRVALKYVASFLGMRIETLSRLRAKFRE